MQETSGEGVATELNNQKSGCQMKVSDVAKSQLSIPVEAHHTPGKEKALLRHLL